MLLKYIQTVGLTPVKRVFFSYQLVRFSLSLISIYLQFYYMQNGGNSEEKNLMLNATSNFGLYLFTNFWVHGSTICGFCLFTNVGKVFHATWKRIDPLTNGRILSRVIVSRLTAPCLILHRFLI